MRLVNLVTSLPPAWAAPLIAGGAALAGYVIYRAGAAILSRIVHDLPTRVDHALVFHLRKPAGLFLPVIAALLALPLASSSALTPVLHHMLVILLIAAIGWAALKLLRALGDILLGHYRIDQADNLTQRQMQTRVLMLDRIGAVAVITVTGAAILMTFPNVRQVGVSLFASAGVAGLVVGLAARSAIANVIAGVQVALAQPIRVDDVVIVEGEWGWIEEITMTFVVVRIWDQRRLVVPLSYFIEKPFQNWTRRTADILGTVMLYADYTVPVGKIREELTRLVQDHPKWDGKVCGLQVTDATERTVALRALVSASNSGDAWNLRCDVREGLIDFLQKHFPECLPRLRAEVDGEKQAQAMPQQS